MTNQIRYVKVFKTIFAAITNLVSHLSFILVFVAASSLTACLPESQTGTATDSASTTPSNPGYTTTPNPGGPPPSQPPQTQPTTPQDPIRLNDGAPVTSDATIKVSIFKGDVDSMKISTNALCDGGAWEPYGNTKMMTLTTDQMNKPVFVSVQFRDSEFIPSNCYAAFIRHDNAPPQISFIKYPAPTLPEGTGAEIIYEVVDTGVGVDSSSVTCSLNGLIQACSPNRTTVTIPQMGPGQYYFEVVAKDHLGFENRSTVMWEVTSNTRLVSHDIRIDEYRKWDILFVIDNSGSMEYEQKSMANRTRNFLSVLRGLDWQIGITTTDPRNIALGDGRLIKLTGANNQYLINSSMPEADAQALLSNTLQRTETGSGSEQGIRAVYRAVERSLAPENTSQSALFRPSSHFAVVLISDEDESDNTTKNDPNNLMTLVSTTFNGQKNFSFNSIITRPGDTACKSTYGYSYGERFKVMTDLTQGVLGSVCEMDYAAQITGIAQKILGMAKTFTLSCEPVAGKPITIARNGVAVTAPFVVQGIKLSFDQPIEPGDYRLQYMCLK